MQGAVARAKPPNASWMPEGKLLLDSPLPTVTFTASIIYSFYYRFRAAQIMPLVVQESSQPDASTVPPMCILVVSGCLFPEAIHSSLCKIQSDYISSLSYSRKWLERKNNSHTKEGSVWTEKSGWFDDCQHLPDFSGHLQLPCLF